jgi:hypothetical protein
MKNVRWIFVAAALLAGACGDDGDSNTPDGPRFDGPPQGDGGIDAVPPTSCSMPATLADPATVTGDNSSGANTIDGVCSLDVGGGGAPEVIYQLTPAVTGELQVRVSGIPDLAVYARTTCADAETEIACADFLASDPDGVLPSEEGFGIASTAGTPVFIVVDGYDADTGAGSYSLHVASADNGPACTGTGVTAAALGDNAGTTVGGTDLLGGSCTGAFLPEKVFTYTVPGTSANEGTLTLTLASDSDQGLHARTACTDPTSQIACQDFQFGGTDEVVVVPVHGAGTIAVIVEPYTLEETGPFNLNVAYQQATCGDSMLHGFEECDPPNALTCGTDCRFLPEGSVTPATQCTNWVDDDGDDRGDCGDTGCQAAAECAVGAGLSGTACDAATDCAATSSDPGCIGEHRFGWPSGYCAEHCSDTDACPAGSECVGYQDQELCIKTCTTMTDCPSAGYACNPSGFCVPSCTMASDCPLEGACNTDTGLCGNPELNFCADALDNDGDFQTNCIDADCVGDSVSCPRTEVETNDTFGAANVYATGFRGFIALSGDQDWVSVALLAGQTMVAETNDFGTGACLERSLDSELVIYGSDGTTEIPAGDLSDDISLSNYCSRATIGPVAANGVHYVKVIASTLAPDGTFGYGLTVTITGP